MLSPLLNVHANLHILQVTHYLGGENYVFWGGREGYQTLLNTDMGRELDHLVCFIFIDFRTISRIMLFLFNHTDMSRCFHIFYLYSLSPL